MRKVQHIPGIPLGLRIETGAVQFGDDWPGMFIRGDSAMQIMHSIKRIAERLSYLQGEEGPDFKPVDPVLYIALMPLLELAETIKSHVIVPPQKPAARERKQ